MDFGCGLFIVADWFIVTCGTKELKIQKFQRSTFTLVYEKDFKNEPFLESWTPFSFEIVLTLPWGDRGWEIGDISRTMGDC